MFMEQTTGMMEKYISKIKDASPEERDHFVNSAITLLEASTEMLKISPEFRKAFAKVHIEFLKYPECRETIEQGMKAYSKFSEEE